MASGDVQRAWFPEMLADLKQRWLSHEMTWDELAVFCREMTEQRQEIKEAGNIKKSWGTCNTCGGKLSLGPISIRSALFALRKTGAIDHDRFKSLDRDWAKYRKMNGLQPKAHLIKNGFDAMSFAIEVKSPIANESVKKLLDCIIQAYTYFLCQYRGVHPAFVLIYPDVEKFFEYDFAYKYKKDPRNRFNGSEIIILRRLMQRANVGELIVDGRDYEINFAAAYYYSSKKGRSGIKNLGITRRIGSKKVQLKLMI